MDLSKIDRMELRQRIIELDKARIPLAKASDDEEALHEEAPINSAYETEREKLAQIRYEAQQKARDDYNAALKALDASFPDKSMPARDALAKHDAAPEYRDVDCFDDDTGAAVCCVLSGLPILDDDVTVEDSDCRRALVAAIPGWPIDSEAKADAA